MDNQKTNALVFGVFLALVMGCVQKTEFADPVAVNDGMPIRHGFWFEKKDKKTAKVEKKVHSERVKRGQALYFKNCAACHGKDARGDGGQAKMAKIKPADLRTFVNMFPERTFFIQIDKGKGAMPAWKDMLSKEQIADLTAYLQSLSK